MAALVMGNTKANSTATISCKNCPEKIKEDNWLPMPVARMLVLVMAYLHLEVSFHSGLCHLFHLYRLGLLCRRVFPPSPPPPPIGRGGRGGGGGVFRSVCAQVWGE